MKRVIVLLSALVAILAAIPAFAASVRVYVGEVNAVGVPNRDEMKLTVQTLLASRLNGDRIMAVGSASEADVLVTGTYVTIGKVFSVDALARTAAGKTLARAFVQGEGQDELIPAIGKLADKLSAELVKFYAGGTPAASSSAALVPAAPSPASDIIKSNQQVRQAPVGDIIKATDQQRKAGGWLSRRLNGAANLLATGRALPDGGREIFLAEEGRLSYYRQGSDMKLVAETAFNADEKVISLDTIEGTDGNQDVYVTIIRSGEPSSQVFQIKGDTLVRVADKLAYYFRAISLAGGAKRLYAQAMGRDADFYGDVFEATRSGAIITLKNPIKMPRFGNIYGFNQFRDSEGKVMTVTYTPDGYLAVYDPALKELWRSNDKYGGSELYFQREDSANVRVTDDRYRWIFMNQPIQVTSKGDVLVGKNDGFWVLGNARSYKKGAVFCMAWNGSSLEEKWRTRDTQNYMPDFVLDEARNELLLLQTVQRSGVAVRGASSIAIKKVE
jgi:hypothetical protein